MAGPLNRAVDIVWQPIAIRDGRSEIDRFKMADLTAGDTNHLVAVILKEADLASINFRLEDAVSNTVALARSDIRSRVSEWFLLLIFLLLLGCTCESRCNAAANCVQCIERKT